MTWNNIPLELKRIKAWCFCFSDKIPMYYDGKNCHRSNVNTPNTWMTFEDCVQYAAQLRQSGKDAHIGFILSTADPYVCIDMDVKDASNEKDQAKWTTIDQYNRMTRMVEDFDTYSELSKSGKGFHVWCKGNTPKGRRKDCIELYSNQRFIICTGNSVNNKPIEDRAELVALLYSQMDSETSREYVVLEEIEEEYGDAEIIEIATAAHNGQKYVDLCNGQWQKYNYPSQSEADLALMAMLCFYSKSNEQCRRLFRASALGKREKATRDNRYLNYMITLRRTVQKDMEDVDMSEFQKGLEQIELARQEPALLHVPSAPQTTNIIAPTASTALALSAPDELDDNIPYEGLAWPPGLAGRIAKYMYKTSKRPIREVSIVSTLGILAGVCGKAWHIPDSGLNMYIVILAKSAIGKEDLHGGISKFMAAIASRQPAAWQFVKFSEYASGQALQKECDTSPSFVAVSGEWGRKLKRFSDDRGDGPMASLRTTMTNLYQKSGPRSVVGGISYSSSDKNIASVNGVAFSMVGEATPIQYYNALTESMMEKA